VNPIRYQDLETDYGPRFETDLDAVIAEVEQAVRGSVEAEGEKRAVRFAHAKAYGLLEGVLETLDVADPSCAQGIFATPGSRSNCAPTSRRCRWRTPPSPGPRSSRRS
jgi:hypothetical protein